MRKIMTQVYYALLIVSVSVIVLSYVLAAALEGSPVEDSALGNTLAQTASTAGIALATSTVGLLVVGLTLSFTKNDISKKIGLGFMLSGIGLNAVTAVNTLVVSGENTPYFIYVSLVGIILFAASFVFLAFAYVDKKSTSDDPDQDPAIQKLIKWKKLLEEGVITQDEFTEKRNLLLGIKKDNNSLKK